MNFKNLILKVCMRIKQIVCRGKVDCNDLRKLGMIIGDNVNIYTNKLDLAHGFLIEIGNNVTISDARILAHDASTKMEIGYSKVGEIIIGNNVFIGADVIILPNVRIGNKVIIGAGAVVAKDIPDNSVVIGNPCKIICTYEEYVNKNIDLLRCNPKYDSHYAKKTINEKQVMKNELKGKIGFDI